MVFQQSTEARDAPLRVESIALPVSVPKRELGAALDRRSKPLRITALGGGNGLSVVLRGLRSYCSEPVPSARAPAISLSAIVNVADDGGSSGILRRALKVQPPGDVRNCLLALSNADPTLRALFDFRFDEKIDGHSLGNLMITALTVLEKDFATAVKRASNLLVVQGQVIPAAMEQVELIAQLDDGSYVKGETQIRADKRSVHRLSLLPADAHASPEAMAALAASDLIVIGPGSLYTSLLPNLLLQGIYKTISASRIHVALVMNLMTERGETDGYSATDILSAFRNHLPGLRIHSVLLNTTHLSRSAIRHYAAVGSEPISVDAAGIAAMGSKPVCCSLLARGQKVRHDPIKLARALLNQMEKLPGDAFNEQH